MILYFFDSIVSLLLELSELLLSVLYSSLRSEGLLSFIRCVLEANRNLCTSSKSGRLNSYLNGTGDLNALEINICELGSIVLISKILSKFTK